MWSSPLSRIYLLTISIDRFIAVKFPLKYYQFTTTYTFRLVGGTFLFLGINVFIGIIFTLPHNYNEVAQICFTETAFVTDYYHYYTWLAIACALSSIIVYAAIICLNFNLITLRKSDGAISALQKISITTQRKVRSAQSWVGITLK
jgi:hypothetical protein